MHLSVILAFAMLIWLPPERSFVPPIGGAVSTTAIVTGQVVALFLAAIWCSRRAVRLLDNHPDNPEKGQFLHHRATLVLRVALLLGFGADLFMTRWPELIADLPMLSVVPGLDRLVMITPFFAATLAMWVASYPVDRRLRHIILRSRPTNHQTLAHPADHWTLTRYLTFNARHQLLGVAVPMTIILIAYCATVRHAEVLIRATGVVIVDQVVLGATAAVVFILAPVGLRYIWSTRPLPAGPLRRRLEALSVRAGMRYRDILVWRSGNMLVNAAVMGIVGPLRYVLLSDGLLEALDERRVEAVFGHEVGHVRHRHIQYFVLFAVSSMLLVSGVLELLLRFSSGAAPLLHLGDPGIQVIGVVLVAAAWGIGFGWVSRRFERQADLFGACMIAPTNADECKLPCSAHPGPDKHSGPTWSVCAKGAAVFASALDAVAVLNGMPRNERSWRHSSIGSRVQFLTSLAADPTRARRFRRLCRRVQLVLLVGTIGGLSVAAIYIYHHPTYRQVFHAGPDREAAVRAERVRAAPSGAYD